MRFASDSCAMPYSVRSAHTAAPPAEGLRQLGIVGGGARWSAALDGSFA